jgi:hypothetical protein
VRTHRVAGYLLVAAGAAMIAVTLLRPDAALAVVLFGAIAPHLFCIGYSWWVWRSDPARLPPAATWPAENGR